jgi:hypothetical protein
MSRTARRFFIVLALVAWLLVMLTPTFAAFLARNGQVTLGDPAGPHTRLFLLQDPDAEGLGLERARRVRPPAEGFPGVICLRTTVSYWLWRGEGQPASYCQCLDEATGAPSEAQSPSCLIP